MRRILLFVLPAMFIACAEADKADDDDDGDDDTAEVAGGDDGGEDGGGDDGGGEDGGGEDGGGEDGGGEDGGGEDGGGEDGGGEDGGGEDGGGEDGGGEGGGGDEGGDTGPPPLLPAEGIWIPTGFTVTSDPCSLSSFEDPAGFIPEAFDIAAVSASGFTIGASGEPGTACSYAEPDFVCDVSSSEQDVGLGLDARLLLDNVFSGEVLVEDQIDGRIDLEVECDGSACSILELAGLRFPCLLEGSFDLDH